MELKFGAEGVALMPEVRKIKDPKRLDALVDQVKAGVTLVDGLGVGDIHDVALRDRRKLSFVGIIFATVLVDDHNQLADDIELILDGVPSSLQGTLENAAEKAFDAMQKALTAARDEGGVHINSGVPNHAYALMVDGGSCSIS